MKKKSLLCVVAFLMGVTTLFAQQAKTPVDYVNPLMGTDSKVALSNGNTYPAIALPWGMNFWVPQTGTMGHGWIYTYASDKIRGFKQTHQPSPWAGDYSHLCFLPEIDKLVVDPALRWSGFRPENVTLTPYLMEYHLLRYKTKFKLAPTDTGAIMSIDASRSQGRPLFAIIPFNLIIFSIGYSGS